MEHDTKELGRLLVASRRRETYTCERCGTAWETWRWPAGKEPRFCSDACRTAFHNERRKAERAAAKLAPPATEEPTASY